LTPADIDRIDGLKLAAVVDLRTQEERAISPTVWDHRPSDVYESPKPTLAPMLHRVLDNAQTADGARRGMKAFYADIPDEYRVEYSSLFRRIASGHLPLLVHCTAGKDRTGVAVAVLLLSLGVPQEKIEEDYQLTNNLLPAPAAPAGRSAGRRGAVAFLGGL
jgi:protein-tyrosine phosphatase